MYFKPSKWTAIKRKSQNPHCQYSQANQSPHKKKIIIKRRNLNEKFRGLKSLRSRVELLSSCLVDCWLLAMKKLLEVDDFMIMSYFNLFYLFFYEKM